MTARWTIHHLLRSRSRHSARKLPLLKKDMVGVEEQKKKLWNVMRRISKLNREEEALLRQRGVKEEIRYHGPYTDASGQEFYLPQKYVNDHVQRVDSDFRENEDLDGDKLSNNLSWLGKSGDIMNLVQMQSEDDDDEDDDDESTYPPPPSKKSAKRKRTSVVVESLAGAMMNF